MASVPEKGDPATESPAVRCRRASTAAAGVRSRMPVIRLGLAPESERVVSIPTTGAGAHSECVHAANSLTASSPSRFSASTLGTSSSSRPAIARGLLTSAKDGPRTKNRPRTKDGPRTQGQPKNQDLRTKDERRHLSE